MPVKLKSATPRFPVKHSTPWRCYIVTLWCLLTNIFLIRVRSVVVVVVAARCGGCGGGGVGGGVPFKSYLLI